MPNSSHEECQEANRLFGEPNKGGAQMAKEILLWPRLKKCYFGITVAPRFFIDLPNLFTEMSESES